MCYEFESFVVFKPNSLTETLLRPEIYVLIMNLIEFLVIIKIIYLKK